MLCSVNPRLPQLVDQISKEKDLQKLIALSRQLTGILDENIRAHRDEKTQRLSNEHPQSQRSCRKSAHTRRVQPVGAEAKLKVLAGWFGDPDVRLEESKQAILQERSAREQA
jgi:hypothetical protein